MGLVCKISIFSAIATYFGTAIALEFIAKGQIGLASHTHLGIRYYRWNGGIHCKNTLFCFPRTFRDHFVFWPTWLDSHLGPTCRHAADRGERNRIWSRTSTRWLC